MIWKALSVRSPWWWAIINPDVRKDIENRDWHTKFRGRVLIHASKWYKESEVFDDLVVLQRILKLSDDRTPTVDHHYLFKQSLGHIVGSVEIVDCVSDSPSPWFFGQYGLVLDNPVVFKRPIPFKGALGFFTVPSSVTGQIPELR